MTFPLQSKQNQPSQIPEIYSTLKFEGSKRYLSRSDRSVGPESGRRLKVKGGNGTRRRRNNGPRSKSQSKEWQSRLVTFERAGQGPPPDWRPLLLHIDEWPGRLPSRQLRPPPSPPSLIYNTEISTIASFAAPREPFLFLYLRDEMDFIKKCDFLNGFRAIFNFYDRDIIIFLPSRFIVFRIRYSGNKLYQLLASFDK